MNYSKNLLEPGYVAQTIIWFENPFNCLISYFCWWILINSITKTFPFVSNQSQMPMIVNSSLVKIISNPIHTFLRQHKQWINLLQMANNFEWAFCSGHLCDQHRKLVKVASWWPSLLYQVWGFQTKWVIIQPKEYSKTFASFIFTFSEFQGLKAMYLSTLFSVPRERRVSQSLSLFGT